MHLLSSVEGTPAPLAPPYAPRTKGSMQTELTGLAEVLTESLNVVRSQSGDRVHNLAAHLIEQRDGGRRERAARYADPASIWSSVESGDVVLIRASWLLGRAGFEEIGPGLWVPSRGTVEPLPPRQEIEASFPEAIMPLDMLKDQHRAFKFATQEAVGGYGDEPVSAAAAGAEALPVVAIAHCWETAEHPDPEGRTLRIIASELADGGWEDGVTSHGPKGCPTCGIPLYAAWGMRDVGVFIDWCSLYQGASKSEVQVAACRRAFADHALYFAHRLVTCYVLTGQGSSLTVGREERGWPLYEEAISLLLKASPPPGTYDIGDRDVMLWSKTVQVDREAVMGFMGNRLISRAARPPPKDPNMIEAPEQAAAKDKGKKKATVGKEAQLEAAAEAAAAQAARTRPPPLAPAAFAQAVAAKSFPFSDAADAASLGGLYRAAMEDGFGGLQQLRLAECGWGDADIDVLATTLRDVRAPELRLLDLSANAHWVNGDALAPAIEPFRASSSSSSSSAAGAPKQLFTRLAIGGLTTLRLSRCSKLTSLPSNIGLLTAIQVLDLAWCVAPLQPFSSACAPQPLACPRPRCTQRRCPSAPPPSNAYASPRAAPAPVSPRTARPSPRLSDR